MATLTAGSVVLIRFPFSDLSQTKLRPAVVLADVGRDDWILCQVTSKPYGDTNIVELDNDSFVTGSLQRKSYVRGGKLFTANRSLIVSQVGKLKKESLNEIIKLIVTILQPDTGEADEETEKAE